MANNMQLSNAAASAAMDAICALLNGGSLKFYDGAQPANANTAVGSQNLLATLAFNATAFGASVNGVAQANTIASAAISANGTCTWCRCVKADGVSVVTDLSVGVSGCDINFPTVAFVSGVLLGLSSLTFTHPLH